MVDAIRNVEVAMGDGVRRFSENELEIKKIARKSIILNEDVSEGMTIEKKMLTIKRPGTGIAPKYINQVIGKRVNQDLNKNTVLKWEYLE